MTQNQLYRVIGVTALAIASALLGLPARGGHIENPQLVGSPTNPPVENVDACIWYPYIFNSSVLERVPATWPPGLLADALVGNSSDPDGNVELFCDSEVRATPPPTTNVAFFAGTAAPLPATLPYAQITGLLGDLPVPPGSTILLSSLLCSDWNNGAACPRWTSLPPTTLAQMPSGQLLKEYVHDFVRENGLDLSFLNTCLPGNPGTKPINEITLQYAIGFLAWRFSDPNISYVNQDDLTGVLSIGLAGQLNNLDLFAAVLSALRGVSITEGNLITCGVDQVQNSEVVKVNVPGMPLYLYSMHATPSGYTTADEGSYDGNYEITFSTDIKKAKFTFYYNPKTMTGYDRVSMNGYLIPGLTELPFNARVRILIQVPDPRGGPPLTVLDRTVPAGVVNLDPAKSWKYRYLARGPGINELVFETAQPPLMPSIAKTYLYLFADQIDKLPENQLVAIRASMTPAQYLAFIRGIDEYYLTVQIGSTTRHVTWYGVTPLIRGDYNESKQQLILQP